MVVGVGTNTVNPSGGSVEFSFALSFAGRAGGVTLEQLELTEVTAGSHLVLKAEGRIKRLVTLEPQKGVTQVVSITRSDIDTLTILVPGPFSDDVMLGE